MPSPIAHVAASYAIYYLSRSRQPQMKVPSLGPLPTPLVVAAGFSLLPDVDSVAGVIMGNFGRYHNNATHSLVVGLGVALIFGAIMQWREKQGFAYWFLLALISYEMHVIMDSATISRGVMAFWPFTADRYLLPFRLFYGFKWSRGWISISHLWTFLTESLFAAVLFITVHLLQPQKKLSPEQGS
jgi:inner membrane protein